MGYEFVGDFFREALFIVVLLVVAIILPSLLIGLLVSIFQAATQINEQTLSFLPRLVITLVVIIGFGSWLSSTVIEYAKQLYMNIPYLIH